MAPPGAAFGERCPGSETPGADPHAVTASDGPAALRSKSGKRTQVGQLHGVLTRSPRRRSGQPSTGGADGNGGPRDGRDEDAGRSGRSRSRRPQFQEGPSCHNLPPWPWTPALFSTKHAHGLWQCRTSDRATGVFAATTLPPPQGGHGLHCAIPEKRPPLHPPPAWGGSHHPAPATAHTCAHTLCTQLLYTLPRLILRHRCHH